MFGHGQMGSTLMGPLQSNEVCQIGKRYALARLGKQSSREYQQIYLSKDLRNSSGPISADPSCPFPKQSP